MPSSPPAAPSDTEQPATDRPVTPLPVRPVLKRGLRRLWRGERTLQLGLDPRLAVVVHDADPPVLALLDRLDGSVAAEQLPDAARESGLDPDDVVALVRRLAAHGVLEDADGAGTAARTLTVAERDRLAPDVAAWSLAADDLGGGPAVHARRRAARVDVHGAGRVGALAAALLTHACIGELRVEDPDTLRPGDVPAPWARTCPPDSTPPGRSELALDVCEQLAPSLRTPRRAGGRRPSRDSRPSAALLAPVDSAGTVALEERDELVRAGVPHLPAFVRETVGVVGPFVLPGRSTCLRCVDLARSERDPAWPRLLAQLCPPPPASAARERRRTSGEAGDGVLATAVAALAVAQVLALVDGRTPSSVGATLELGLEDGLARRKPWPRHPACGCGWR